NAPGLNLALQSCMCWKIALALLSHLAQGHISTKERTFRGCLKASCCAMILPIEQPITLTFSKFSASNNPAQSSAINAEEYGPSGLDDRPTPLLSTRIHRKLFSHSATCFSQAEAGPVMPIINKRGSPEP